MDEIVKVILGELDKLETMRNHPEYKKSKLELLKNLRLRRMEIEYEKLSMKQRSRMRTALLLILGTVVFFGLYVFVGWVEFMM